MASFFLHPPLELKVAESPMMTVSVLDSVELPGRFKRVSFPYASAYSKSTYPGSPNPTGSLSFEVVLPKVESKASKGELFLVQELLLFRSDEL